MSRRSEFRRRRIDQGFTQEGLADELGVSVNSVSAWESGARRPGIENRSALARALGATQVEINRWFSEGAETADGIMPEWLGTLAAMEQGASEIWTYEPIVIPGLAQTAGYARAVQEGEPGPPDRHEIRLAVKARLARQEVLDRSPDPLRLHMLIDESVLHRPVGGAKVMATQLAHLLDLATRANVTIQVLPFDSGVYSAAFGHFAVLSSPRCDRPYMAHVLDRRGVHYLDRREDVDSHVRLWHHLLTAALSESDTLDLIKTHQERHHHQ